MKNILNEILNKKDRKEFKEFKEFVVFVANQPTGIWLRNGIIQLFRQYCDQYNKPQRFRRNSSMYNYLKKTQVLFLAEGALMMLHRYAFAKYHFCRIRLDGAYMDLRLAGATPSNGYQKQLKPCLTSSTNPPMICWNILIGNLTASA